MSGTPLTARTIECETRNVYNIGGPALNEEAGPGWWKKEPTTKLPIPDEEEEDLEFNNEKQEGEAIPPMTPPAKSPRWSRDSSPDRNLEASLDRDEGAETIDNGGLGPWKYLETPEERNVRRERERIATTPTSMRWTGEPWTSASEIRECNDVGYDRS